MADLKISQLTGATTPLAGTEVLPIVQSSTTKKVAVSDLTAGRTVAMLKGVFTNTGGASSADFSNTIFQDVLVNIFNASGTVGNKITVQFASNGGATTTNAITSYGSSFGSGLNNAIDIGNSSGAVRVTTAGDVASTAGNFVPATAAKGINFTANTPAAGMTSQLLNWYEEGTWTPATTASGATYVAQTGQYVKVGKVITCTANIQWSAHTNAGANLAISGLPYASSSSATYPSGTISGNLIIATDHSIQTYILPSTSTITFLDCTDTTGGTAYYVIPASANISINYTYITG